MVIVKARQVLAATGGLRRAVPRVDDVASGVSDAGFVVLDRAVVQPGVGPVAQHRAQAGVAAGRPALRRPGVLSETTHLVTLRPGWG